MPAARRTRRPRRADGFSLTLAASVWRDVAEAGRKAQGVRRAAFAFDRLSGTIAAIEAAVAGISDAVPVSVWLESAAASLLAEAALAMRATAAGTKLVAEVSRKMFRPQEDES